MESRDAIVGRDRPVQPVGRGAGRAGVECEIPEQRDRFLVVRLFRENFLACGPRLGQPRRLAQPARLGQQPGGRIYRRRARNRIGANPAFPGLQIRLLQGPRDSRFVHERRMPHALAQVAAQLRQARNIAGHPRADRDILVHVVRDVLAHTHCVEQARAHASCVTITDDGDHRYAHP